MEGEAPKAHALRAGRRDDGAAADFLEVQRYLGGTGGSIDPIELAGCENSRPDLSPACREFALLDSCPDRVGRDDGGGRPRARHQAGDDRLPVARPPSPAKAPEPPIGDAGPDP